MTKLQYVGADPEMFVRDKKTKQFVSAHGLIPGTKKDPYPVKSGAIQVDGMAAEFNIHPAATEDEFVKNIDTVLGELGRMMPGYDLVAQPCVTFSEEVWDGVPDEAKILGCEPDFNAWTSKENNPPNPEVDFRTAAGHIHLGWTEGVDIEDQGHRQACEIMARELDMHLAFPATLLDNTPDAAKRRELYGCPGAYRPKSYGMEYRVLSNWWLRDEKYARWVYQVCQEVFNNLLVGKFKHQELNKLVQKALTTYHEYDLNELIEMQGLVYKMPPGWKEHYFRDRENPFDSAIYMFGAGKQQNATIYF